MVRVIYYFDSEKFSNKEEIEQKRTYQSRIGSSSANHYFFVFWFRESGKNPAILLVVVLWGDGFL